MRLLAIAAVLVLYGCRVETPHYQLPQGYSETYRQILHPPEFADSRPPLGTAIDLSRPGTTLSPSTSTFESDFTGGANAVLPGEPADTELLFEPRSETEKLFDRPERLPLPRSDFELIVPPPVNRAPGLRRNLPPIDTRPRIELPLP